MRTLLIFIALAVIVALGKRLWRQPRARPPQAAAGNMVQCAHCGIFVPEQEALSRNGRWYCSKQHRDADDT